MKFRFKPEDFAGLIFTDDFGKEYFPNEAIAACVAERANVLIEEAEKKCERVVKAAGYGHHDTWIERYDELDGPPTHTALLWNVENIKSDVNEKYIKNDVEE